MLYLISLNATETGDRGNDFLGILGGLATALLEFLRGVVGGSGVQQALGL